ncbi:protein-L-isoaspartate(D-aspartate) O-methyltransferase [Tomitella fengzijianii]|uniref:Protein-L-isoaspartate O-methyltransferase n=1 Tax=Tomitella fengzijianii TaxID=2597660 RepID=A0A516X428_9ACTN|nr:protein-L-isoaspartate(D-aspartate) O-methyltransferase [Tomitella fengzijianii]QDQ97828.1 protein-L-isoaspartate(D-aspartate) O-methyltransferase [Tomitella fengzijianii]
MAGRHRRNGNRGGHAVTDAPGALDARREMVGRLRRKGLTDPRVLEAMSTVPRERFIPEQYAAMAYEDRPVPIGAGQTVSAPDIVALTATALALTGRESVLEVGGGSGYAAAVLALCASHVITIERRAHLADRARRVLGDLGYDTIEVRHADGMTGAPDAAPFDAIAVAAMAHEIPPALFDQLAPDGVLVCPVGDASSGELLLAGAGRRTSLSRVSFVPLVEGLDR